MKHFFEMIKLKILFFIFINRYFLHSLMVYTRLIKNGKDIDHSDFSALIDTFSESLLAFDKNYSGIIKKYKDYFITKYIDLIKSHKNKYIDGIYYDIMSYFVKQSRKKLQIVRDLVNKMQCVEKMFTDYYSNGCEFFNKPILSLTLIDMIAIINKEKILPLHKLDPYLMKIKMDFSSKTPENIDRIFMKDFKMNVYEAALSKASQFSNNLRNIDIPNTLKSEINAYFMNI